MGHRRGTKPARPSQGVAAACGHRRQQPATWNGGGRPEDSSAHGDRDAPQEAEVGKKGGREKKGREERSSPEAAAGAEEDDSDDDCPMAACEDGGRTGSPLTFRRRRGSWGGEDRCGATARVGVDRSGGATRLESAAAAKRGGSRGYGATEVERGNGAVAELARAVAKLAVAAEQCGGDPSDGKRRPEFAEGRGGRIEHGRGGVGAATAGEVGRRRGVMAARPAPVFVGRARKMVEDVQGIVPTSLDASSGARGRRILRRRGRQWRLGLAGER
ncbi:hypothetical protein [Oryza sativa Japonica Group]|uniref:Uncharacterized protein n=1 Tax=Oryza sativa subsp. japonica TaxID=39947 RepID=Q5VP73_ORYSJ|nr:hypothetical protein [Oryza sativa Japonica Group]